jgi:hypothetical protein
MASLRATGRSRRIARGAVRGPRTSRCPSPTDLGRWFPTRRLRRRCRQAASPRRSLPPARVRPWHRVTRWRRRPLRVRPLRSRPVSRIRGSRTSRCRKVTRRSPTPNRQGNRLPRTCPPSSAFRSSRAQPSPFSSLRRGASRSSLRRATFPSSPRHKASRRHRRRRLDRKACRRSQTRNTACSLQERTGFRRSPVCRRRVLRGHRRAPRISRVGCRARLRASRLRTLPEFLPPTARRPQSRQPPWARRALAVRRRSRHPCRRLRTSGPCRAVRSRRSVFRPSGPSLRRTG